MINLSFNLQKVDASEEVEAVLEVTEGQEAVLVVVAVGAASKDVKEEEDLVVDHDQVAIVSAVTLVEAVDKEVASGEAAVADSVDLAVKGVDIVHDLPKAKAIDDSKHPTATSIQL